MFLGKTFSQKQLERKGRDYDRDVARAARPTTKEKTVNEQRERAYVAIDTERDYQDAGRGNAQRHADAPDRMTPGEIILCMEKCLADARAAWYAPDGGTKCLPHVRKVAALAVQCMENYGAPVREAV